MDDAEFDRSLIAAAFDQAALGGWRDVRVAEAARSAGLALDRARARFPGRDAVLLRFGEMADQAALEPQATEPTGRERLFDVLMRRFDAMQPHREGIIALLRGLPFDPATGLLLYGATLRSMAWMLDGTGVPTTGVKGAARVHGLLAVWLYAVRAWEQDDSPDLSGTMAALDRALDRAVQAESWFGRPRDDETAASSAMSDLPGLPPDPLMDPMTDPTMGFDEPGDLNTTVLSLPSQPIPRIGQSGGTGPQAPLT